MNTLEEIKTRHKNMNLDKLPFNTSFVKFLLIKELLASYNSNCLELTAIFPI